MIHVQCITEFSLHDVQNESTVLSIDNKALENMFMDSLLRCIRLVLNIQGEKQASIFILNKI